MAAVTGAGGDRWRDSVWVGWAYSSRDGQVHAFPLVEGPLDRCREAVCSHTASPAELDSSIDTPRCPQCAGALGAPDSAMPRYPARRVRVGCQTARRLPVGNVLEQDLVKILGSPEAYRVRAELARIFTARAAALEEPDPECQPHCKSVQSSVQSGLPAILQPVTV